MITLNIREHLFNFWGFIDEILDAILIVPMTYAVVVFSIIAQGLTLNRLVKRLQSDVAG